MNAKRWARATGFAAALAVTGAAFAQESPNTYYAYPASVGVGYQPLSPVSTTERPVTANDLSLHVRVPLPFLPVLQPFLQGGLATLNCDEPDDPTILGGMLDEGATLPDYDPRTVWDHQQWFAALGLGYAHRISREFEVGAHLFGGLGQSYFPRRVVTSAGEWYPVGELGLLAGAGGKVSINPTFNLSIDVIPTFRYQRSLGNLPDFDGLYFGIGFAAHYRFGQDPDAPQAEVRALRFSVDEVPPVFASMQKVYVRRPITHVTITNTEAAEVRDLQVSFNQATYMDSPSLCAEIDSLAPGESVDVPLFASFNDAVFTTVDVVPLNGEIIASYSYRGRATEQRRSLTFNLQDRNALVWDDDRKVAAFITPRDSAVRNYASFVGDRSAPERSDYLPRELEFAMQAYHALAAIDIGYQVDPTSPFTEVHGSAFVIDDVSLPRETLRRGTGDCDDLTVLYNTMLESVGIASGFVTIPGHIYSAFDTGLSPRDYARIHPDREMSLAVGDSLWVLVEITLIGRAGFIDAWESGMEQWHSYAGNEAARSFFTTRESQLEYEPVGLQEADIGLQYGDPERFLAAFRRDRDRLAALLLQPVRDHAEARGRPRDWNRYGIAAAELRQFREADDAFTRATRADPAYLAARVNLGALRFLQQDFRGALTAFESAQASLARTADPPEEVALSVAINLARTLHELGRYDEAARHLAEAERIDPAEASRYRYVASADPSGARASAADAPSIRFVVEEDEP